MFPHFLIVISVGNPITIPSRSLAGMLWNSSINSGRNSSRNICCDPEKFLKVSLNLWRNHKKDFYRNLWRYLCRHPWKNHRKDMHWNPRRNLWSNPHNIFWRNPISTCGGMLRRFIKRIPSKMPLGMPDGILLKFRLGFQKKHLQGYLQDYLLWFIQGFFQEFLLMISPRIPSDPRL